MGIKNAAFELETHADLRAVKEHHVRSMAKFLIVIRASFWILFAIVLGALLLLAKYRIQSAVDCKSIRLNRCFSRPNVCNICERSAVA